MRRQLNFQKNTKCKLHTSAKIVEERADSCPPVACGFCAVERGEEIGTNKGLPAVTKFVLERRAVQRWPPVAIRLKFIYLPTINRRNPCVVVWDQGIGTTIRTRKINRANEEVHLRCAVAVVPYVCICSSLDSQSS